MTTQRFSLKGEFIELNALLKLLALAPSGGAAKTLIASGAVSVDGVAETRVRRKLRDGNTVRIADEEVLVTMPAGAAVAPSQGGAAIDTELRSSEPASPPALGWGPGGKVVS
jgi:ribosome-associated protein